MTRKTNSGQNDIMTQKRQHLSRNPISAQNDRAFAIERSWRVEGAEIGRKSSGPKTLLRGSSPKIARAEGSWASLSKIQLTMTNF